VLDRLARERQRQQLVRVAPVDRGPGQMLGNERRLEAAHQRLEAREVAFVERIGGAERKADAVQAQRIERAGALERRERRAAVGEEVLAVDLDQRERGTARDIALLALGGLRARLGELAAPLLARALGHHLPVRRIVVARRLAGARMARRAAIVLAGRGDAVALLLGSRILGTGARRERRGG